MNPPGVMVTMSAWADSSARMTCAPKSVPAPISSRMAASSVIAPVKPSPMPSPSSSDSSGGFRNANASARAKMMQLTTISGM